MSFLPPFARGTENEVLYVENAVGSARGRRSPSLPHRDMEEPCTNWDAPYAET